VVPFLGPLKLLKAAKLAKVAKVVEAAKGAERVGSAVVKYRPWPAADGFLGASKVTVLKPGTLIDRYGSDAGRFASPQGTLFGARGLPSARAGDPYSVFEVQRRTVVKSGTAGPWLDSGGGGIQHILPASVEDLLGSGYLGRVG